MGAAICAGNAEDEDDEDELESDVSEDKPDEDWLLMKSAAES